jgi:hypothetical protein
MIGNPPNWNSDQYHPSGPCRLYEDEMDPEILNKLQLEADHRHRLKGAYTLDPIPIACFRASDDKQFRQFKQDIVGLTSWIWDTPFGRVTSFRADAPVKGKKNPPRARLFVPTDEAFARTIYAQGRLVFFVTFQGKRTHLYEIDFLLGVKGGIEALSYIDTHNRSPIIYHDPELAFWLVLASKAKSWEAELKITDRLSINWANSFFDRWQTLFNF